MKKKIRKRNKKINDCIVLVEESLIIDSRLHLFKKKKKKKNQKKSSIEHTHKKKKKRLTKNQLPLILKELRH